MFATLKRPSAQLHRIAASRGGWVQNVAMAKPPAQGAEVLDNFFPTVDGIRLRRGKVLHATLDDDVAQLMNWNAGSSPKLFAAEATKIYDITAPADADVTPTASVTGLTSGDWSYLNFGTTGGNFLLMANGADDMLLFDGSLWFPVDDADIYALDYDAETAAFAAGETLTGGTSGATATIRQVDDDGTTGTLYLTGITGTFEDDETITSAAGSATANGTPALQYAGLSGVTTSGISHLWAWKSRVFLVEEGTLSAWYLGAESITGTATEFPLKSVFTRGGSLLFGATLSVDGGDGNDDACVFVTDAGEVAVYEGTDPGDATTFALAGVYRIGKPLSKHAHFRAGGDVAIATEDGVISLAATLRGDAGGAAITHPIEDAWRQAVTLRSASHKFNTTLWSSRTMLLASVPDDYLGGSQAFVANSRTGAWCRFTGWDMQCSIIHDDKLYFGEASGKVYRGEEGGADDDAPYTAFWLPKFMGDGSTKALLQARIVYRGDVDLAPELTGAANYEVEYPAAPPQASDEAGSAWGTGVWGVAVWGAVASRTPTTEWQSVAGAGHAVSIWTAATSGRTTAPDCDLISVEYLCETGRPL